jgi:hypothetical protein
LICRSEGALRPVTTFGTKEENMVKLHRVTEKVLAIVFVLCFSVGGLLVCPSAHATATASSVATIDWTSFTMALGSGMGLTWTQQGDWSEAAVKHNGVQKDQQAQAGGSWVGGSGWGDTSATASFTTANGYGTGTASTTASELKAVSSASSNLGGNFEAGAHGWSENRSGRFVVTGTGTITFSVNYALSTTLFETLARPNDLAMSNVEAGLYLLNNTSPANALDAQSIWKPHWDPPLNGTLSKAGTLNVSLLFNDGDTGYFAAMVTSGSEASSVPLPSALYLLAPGLACIVGLRRRFTR